MPPPLPAINGQVNYVGTLYSVKILADAATFRRLYCKLARSLVSFSDCTRVMRDIVLGVLCGATMGLFAAMVGDFF
jgi:hypothetical protein